MLYLIGGLIAATLVASGIASCEHKQKNAAQAEREAVQARFDGFVIEARRKGEEQERAAKDQEEKQRVIHAQTVALLKGDLANRDADLKRLRERPPADPGGREVPVLACGPAGADGAAEKLVPLAEYRALEERSYDDALRLTRLQQWLRDTSHPVE